MKTQFFPGSQTSAKLNVRFFVGGAPAPPPTFFVGLRPPWKILGKSMDKSRVFGNPDFGKKSRFENKLAVFCKVLKVRGEKFQSCGIHFSMRFQAW